MVLRSLAKDWTAFVDGWLLAAQHTPSLVMTLRPDQQTISQQRMAHMSLLAFRCDLTPSTLVRALGTSLHGIHRIELFEQQKTMLQQILTPTHYEHLERVLKVGAPHRLVEHSNAENHRAFLEAGNHGSARQKAEVLDDCANRDERELHTLALPTWMTAFVANLHVSPLAVLTKNGKKPRLIFDASFRPCSKYVALNDSTDVSHEWVITYGTAASSYLNWVWNLRLTFPQQAIYQYFDDVKNAFRHIYLHPDVVGAHGSRTETGTLLLPTRAVFGQCASPPSYMIPANSRAGIAQVVQSPDGEPLRDPPYEFEASLPWKILPDHMKFVQAEGDTLNMGIMKDDGTLELTPHHPFVDDTCLADTRERLPGAIHASLQALFMTFGYPRADRVAALSVEKFQEVVCSERQIQLGVFIDTRNMTVALPHEKYRRIYSLLTDRWHKKRKRFRPLDAARLLGLLRHACVVAWWGKYAFLALQSMLNLALRRECARLLATAKRKENKKEHPNPVREGVYYGRWNAMLTEVSKYKHDAWLMSNKRADLPKSFLVNWKQMGQINISKELHLELEFLRALFGQQLRHEWSSPIAQSVTRSHHFTMHTDASLEGLGAICHELRFMMRISVPTRIVRRTTKYMVTGTELININDMELAAAILAYAGVKLAVYENRHQQCSVWPVLLLYIDNMTAKKYIEKGTTNTPTGRALLRIFGWLTRKSDVSLNTEHIPGIKNIAADMLSRNAKQFDMNPTEQFEKLFALFPQTVGYEIYQPEPKLLSAVWYALQNRTLPDRLLEKMRAREIDVPNTLGSFVRNPV